MIKKWKHFAGIGALLAVAVAVLTFYQAFVQNKIYSESSSHLMSTYEQVDKSFNLFTQRNWNLLSSWEQTLSELGDEGSVENLWSEARGRKNSWNYSDVYLFNQQDHFITAGGRKGVGKSIEGAFEEMYKADAPWVSSYIASSGKRKIVFSMPLDRPLSLDGVTYTGLALSYNNDVVSEMVTSSIYDGKSDCYVVRADGDVVLSLQPKSEFTPFIGNLFGFLKHHVTFDRSNLKHMERAIASSKNGHALCTYNGVARYLVYQPVGIGDWSIVGVVRADAVDHGMEEVRNATIALLSILSLLIVGMAVGMVMSYEHRHIESKEEEKRKVEHEKELTEQLFHGMTSIVDRFAVADLVAGTYEYHEHMLEKPLYAPKGAYSDLLATVSTRYVILTDTGDAKFSRLLAPERLRRDIRPGDPIHKFEYTVRNEDVYKVMNIVPLTWDEEGKLERVMFISQDIGQKIELQTMANTDGLTGLFNERYFSARLAVKERIGEQFVLFYLDLDRFKPVNDTYGHDVGDKLLKAVAKRLLKCTRPCDLAFRIGGDEFALIVTNGMDDQTSEALAARIDRAMGEPFVVDGHVITVGASCGWARHPEEGTASEVRVLADQRMYDSKRRHHAAR